MSEVEYHRIIDSVSNALIAAECCDKPYKHWLISDLFPGDLVQAIQSLTFPIADLGGASGKREFHNDTRNYFDQNNIQRYPVVGLISNAFQSPEMVRKIQDFFNIDLEDSLLRIEYAQDTTGFWLEPHTDLGVKRLTMLIYMSGEPGHETLGTDVFESREKWASRTPFAPNKAMAFVPGDNTFHGFQERPINGIRKSLILNYVTTEWRDRDQLAFPNQPILAE